MSLPSVVAEAAGPREGRRGKALRLLAITLLTLFCVGAARAPTVAQPAPAAAEAAPGDAQSGSLMLRNGERYVEAVRLGTDVELVVSGPTVRAQVTQAFRNTTNGWVEAVYVYPLPEDGAVDSLKMVVGNRVVVGEIKPREEALAVYEAAREEGLAAALVEQERPNLFTNSIANIGPGETVVVQIEYQAPVARSGDVYSLRVPLVSGVRYTPAPRDGHDPVPDRHRIDSPVLDPRVHGRTNPVTLTVRLQPGFELGVVKSAYHAVDVRPEGAGRVVTLRGPVPADRDFELTWRPVVAAAPAAGLFHERVAGKDYVLAFVTPPSFRRPGPPPAREIVFVIDNSGSMDGESMPQAKASLDFALRRLRPGDRFNVVRFDDTLQVLYPDTVPADAAHLAQARAFVAGLEAQGGTEMLPALKAALADRRPGDTRFLRQVVFLTDGQIGDEAELLEAMGAGRGRSRVFMVGIGSAPNSYLMSRAAEIGRGAFTHIGSPEEVEADMRALFEKLESPAAVALEAEFDGVKVKRGDIAPAVLPDLYVGEPLVLVARVSARRGVLRLRATVDGRPWEIALPLADATPGQGLSKLWARRRITDVEVARSLGRLEYEAADAQLLELALEHHLVTEVTSLVAVDRTPKRPADAPLTRAEVPINLPAGWDFDTIFGHVAGDRAARAEAGQGAESVDLPQTATDAGLRLRLGLLLCVLAAALAWALGRGRRRPAERAA